MKVSDYEMVVEYHTRVGILRAERLCAHWPNLLATDAEYVKIKYKGIEICNFLKSGSDYHGRSKVLSLFYFFPKDCEDALNVNSVTTDRVDYRMMSSNKDLRPLVVELLLNECDVVIKLPESDFQLNFAVSLKKYLVENYKGAVNVESARVPW